MQAGHVVINTEKKPIKVWAEAVEEGALSQAENLANLPFLFKWVCLMPDVHQGYGMPIGGVIATEDTIIPNAVGVDIGCGVCAVRFDSRAKEYTKRMLIMLKEELKMVIPRGFKHHETQCNEKWMPEGADELMVCAKNYNDAKRQMGTLGGGNHFIEIQQDQDGYLWAMIHSGSRNLGYKVAKFYNKIAIRRNKRWHSSVDPKHELAFLATNSHFGKLYKKEMEFCVDFAKNNRKFMMDNVVEIMNGYIPTDIKEAYDVAHNYAALENHFGRNVMVHRKGAIRVRKREWGIIPGDCGSGSYIVKGLGNKESFYSCSHGAGRLMSRTQAKKVLDLKKQRAYLKDVVHDIDCNDKLDEAPGSYKCIEFVMDYQRDLIKEIKRLTPLMVIKG